MKHDFWNQFAEVISGAEGDESTESDDDNTSDEDNDDSSGDQDESTQDNQSTDKKQEDFDNLEKALRAERRRAKALERDLKKAQATQVNQQQEENGDLEKTASDLAAERNRSQKLAAGLLKRDIDAAITEQARAFKFLDVEDALNGVDRNQIVFDQDEDDPSEIDVDMDTVKAVVKSLATRKPHFLSRGTEDGDATASSFGNTRSKNKKSSEEELREHYPSL